MQIVASQYKSFGSVTKHLHHITCLLIRASEYKCEKKINRKCSFRLVMCPGMDDVRCSLADKNLRWQLLCISLSSV